MSARATPDIALLDWPLDGTRRIEASAGTGKTFALALLHTRLVVERELPVKRILAVTYTIAATQELRERLRRQLARAAELALIDRDALRAKADGTDAEAITAGVLARRLEHEKPALLAARLRRAVGEIDLAPIHTIHAFCQRVLDDHALATGEPLLSSEFVTSERALHDEIALDVWRRFTRDAVTATRLDGLWKTPDALARDLRSLLVAEALLPARAPVDVAALAAHEAAIEAAGATLRETWLREGANARRLIEEARSGGVLHKGSPSDRALHAAWSFLASFVEGAVPDEDLRKTLDVLTPSGIEGKVNRKFAHAPRPKSMLFEAIDAFLTALRVAARPIGEARVNLLHDVRDCALARMLAIKRERGLLGFDDLVERVHSALSSTQGARLAEALRHDYPAALVDEFQDTDGKQWDVFRRVYVEHDDATRPALFLIGDPKQAIYRFRGGDVHTYHAAGEYAESTETLDQNFRSRPRMIEAIAAVFAEGGEFPFADGETRFPAVRPSGTVADADLSDGKKRAAPALHLINLSSGPSAAAAMRVAEARDRAASTAAAQISSLLTDAPLTLRRDGHERRVEPGDIAVLVNRHLEAERMQRELALRGIASVTATRASVFGTNEAVEILRILEALLATGDESRLRAALASVLIGADAATIDALSRDEDAHRAWLDAFQLGRQQWQRFGPLAFVGPLVAKAAPRLLKLADGERRMTNYLHIAEAVQEARARVLGEVGQADWLARRIADADDFDEAQQQRLESDAARVRIMTLHKAKGLEFDLVFLPFAAIAPSDSFSGGLGLVAERVDGRRVLRARIAGIEDDAYELAAETEKREILAEQLRLLYVGLTRARHAAWLYACVINYGGDKSALSWLLHRQPDGKVSRPKADMIDAAFDRLARVAPRAIAVDVLPDVVSRALQFPPVVAEDDSMRTARRVVRRDWWVHSFSQLAREDSGAAVDEQGAEDEPVIAEAIDPVISPYIGARFGNALHGALETIDFARWLDWRADAPPAGEDEPLRHALGANGYVEEDVAGGMRLLSALVRDTVNVRLPEGMRLADIPIADRRAEIEFHFAMRPVLVDRLVELLHRHDMLRDRDGFGTRERLEGLMTGRIDLVYQHGEKVYLLDYKSNRLADYSQAGLARSIVESEYDLQYLIYTLALHRWLRFRRADYDYDAHFGGVRYLFCRGLDPSHADSPGVFVARPSRAFIDELDMLLAPPRREAA
jgi:exodeoxyribonuclease V beta subunit